jgi:hypothetical protein
MPQDRPGALTTEEYVAVTAYVMQLAGFKGGDVALRADTAVMRHERIRLAVSADTSKPAATKAAGSPAKDRR